MQPINDTTQDGDDASDKISIYRAIVARGDSDVWRGNARNKVAVGIEEGSMISSTNGLEEKTEEVDDVQTVSFDIDPKSLPTKEDEKQDTGTSFAAMVNTDSDSNRAILGGDLESVELGPGTKTEPTEILPNDLKPFNHVDQKENDESVGKETIKDEEPDIPIIYKNWESTLDDEETEMDDIELGEGLATDKHYGECTIDDGAFERHKAKEQEWNLRQQRHRCYLAACSMIILTMLFLIAWALAGLVVTLKEDSNKAILFEVNEKALNTMNHDASSYAFKGDLTEFHNPEVSYGDDKVTVRFPTNIFIPEGSSVLYKVYDGPDCSSWGGGARDITGKSNYVEAGLFSADPQQISGYPSQRWGLYLQWESNQVKASPLYKDHSNSDATMAFCVAVGILDPQGLLEHFMETYMVAIWSHDNPTLRDLRTIPITIDPTRRI